MLNRLHRSPTMPSSFVSFVCYCLVNDFDCCSVSNRSMHCHLTVISIGSLNWNVVSLRWLFYSICDNCNCLHSCRPSHHRHHHHVSMMISMSDDFFDLDCDGSANSFWNFANANGCVNEYEFVNVTVNCGDDSFWKNSTKNPHLVCNFRDKDTNGKTTITTTTTKKRPKNFIAPA